jgi:hypothetical protein
MNNLAEKRPTPNVERSISNDRTRAIESESGILLLLERWMLDVCFPREVASLLATFAESKQFGCLRLHWRLNNLAQRLAQAKR